LRASVRSSGPINQLRPLWATPATVRQCDTRALFTTTRMFSFSVPRPPRRMQQLFPLRNGVMFRDKLARNCVLLTCAVPRPWHAEWSGCDRARACRQHAGLGACTARRDARGALFPLAIARLDPVPLPTTFVFLKIV